MDLGSTNGTFLNGKRLESARFYELLPQDVVKFGESTREYVFIRTD
jgi:pSer/pThr/pTyr-binding forkhead associated (FHA) protein